MSMAATHPIAPISRRVIAYLIDGAIVGVVASIGFGIAYAPVFAASTQEQMVAAFVAATLVSLLVSGVLFAWWLVVTAMQGGSGSIGMRIMKLRLVRAENGEKLGFGRALLRNIVFGLTAAIIVGYFSALFDGSGKFQGWHDKAGGALMLDVRGASAPRMPQPDAVPSMPAPPAPVLPAPALPAPVMPAQFPASAQVPPATSFPASASLPTGASSTPAPSAAPAPVLPAPADPAPFTAPALDGDDLIAFVPGITITSPPARPEVPIAPAAPIAPAVAAPAPEAPVAQPVTPAASDFDDDIESTRISVPGHRMIFTWDDGTRVAISGRTIFGRNPSPEIGAMVVPVRDETLSLSKTHFEAAAEPNGAWVLDRYSTNGVTIVRDGVRIACPAGTRVPIRLGDAIEIGDRIVTVGGYV